MEYIIYRSMVSVRVFQLIREEADSCTLSRTGRALSFNGAGLLQRACISGLADSCTSYGFGA